MHTTNLTANVIDPNFTDSYENPSITFETTTQNLFNLVSNSTKGTENTTDDVVGLPVLRPIKTMIRAHRIAAKIFHPFLLLEPTPKEFLNDVKDENIQILRKDSNSTVNLLNHTKKTSSNEQSETIIPHYQSSRNTLPSGGTSICEDCDIDLIYNNENDDESDEYVPLDYKSNYEYFPPLVSSISRSWYSPEEQFQKNVFEEPFDSDTLIKISLNSDIDHKEYCQHFQIVPADVNVRYTVDQHTKDYTAPIPYGNLKFNTEQQIPTITTSERHFHHHLHPILHHHYTANTEKFQVPHNSNQNTFDSHASPISTELFHPSISGKQIIINKQTFIAPAANTQTVQISGNNNGISQSQSTNKGQITINNPNFQSTQIFGNQNAVSQSQSHSQASLLREASNPMFTVPFIIRVPERRIWRSFTETSQRERRSASYTQDLKTVENQMNFLSRIKEIADNDKDLIFITDLENSLLDNIKQTITLGKSKRHVPLVKLILDPKVKIDVHKTLENVGTVAKNSFENEHIPLYHVKNAFSSAKNALMSTLMIPPQNLIIPSKYKIVESGNEEYVRPDDRLNSPIEDDTKETNVVHNPAAYFHKTYQKIGNMLRESVQSGQETITHLAEIAHNTKKAVSSAHSIAPKLVHSSLDMHPILRRFNNSVEMHPILNQLNTASNARSILENLNNSANPSKLVLVTPNILELKHDTEVVGAPHYLQAGKTFVSMGSLLDSLGISNPFAQKVSLIQTEFYPKHQFQARTETPKNVGEYVVLTDGVQPQNTQGIEETLNVLDNAKRVIGASSLYEFLSKIKNSFKERIEQAKIRFKVRVFSHDNRLQEIPQQYYSERTAQHSEFMPISTTVANATSVQHPEEFTTTTTSILNKNTSKFKSNYNIVETSLLSTNTTSDRNLQQDIISIAESRENEIDDTNLNNLAVGAINPVMYKKIFNETLESAKPLDLTNPKGIKEGITLDDESNKRIKSNQLSDSANGSDSLSFSMKMGKKLVTPFMGKVPQQTVDVVYDGGYGKDSNYNEDIYLGTI